MMMYLFYWEDLPKMYQLKKSGVEPRKITKDPEYYIQDFIKIMSHEEYQKFLKKLRDEINK